MANLKVSVTAPLIERATARDSRHCMIAEAILAARPHFRSVIVDLATIRWSNPRTGKRYVCLTPERAGAELVNFDRGEPIEPFDLSLRVIQVTAMVRNTETRAEARADGRNQPHAKRPSEVRRVKGRVSDPVIVGGKPLVTGHLSNRPPSVVAGGMDALPGLEETPPSDSSNVVRSGQRYRQYGRRLLVQ
jgi:hypothetical protein